MTEAERTARELVAQQHPRASITVDETALRIVVASVVDVTATGAMADAWHAVVDVLREVRR